MRYNTKQNCVLFASIESQIALCVLDLWNNLLTTCLSYNKSHARNKENRLCKRIETIYGSALMNKTIQEQIELSIEKFHNQNVLENLFPISAWVIAQSHRTVI